MVVARTRRAHFFSPKSGKSISKKSRGLEPRGFQLPDAVTRHRRCSCGSDTLGKPGANRAKRWPNQPRVSYPVEPDARRLACPVRRRLTEVKPLSPTRRGAWPRGSNLRVLSDAFCLEAGRRRNPSPSVRPSQSKWVPVRRSAATWRCLSVQKSHQRGSRPQNIRVKVPLRPVQPCWRGELPAR